MYRLGIQTIHAFGKCIHMFTFIATLNHIHSQETLMHWKYLLSPLPNSFVVDKFNSYKNQPILPRPIYEVWRMALYVSPSRSPSNFLFWSPYSSMYNYLVCICTPNKWLKCVLYDIIGLRKLLPFFSSVDI